MKKPLFRGIPSEMRQDELDKSSIYAILNDGASYVRVLTGVGERSKGVNVYDVRIRDGQLEWSQMEMQPIWTYPMSSDALLSFEETWQLNNNDDIAKRSNVFIGRVRRPDTYDGPDRRKR